MIYRLYINCKDIVQYMYMFVKGKNGGISGGKMAKGA
jgi:hypothetical protein